MEIFAIYDSKAQAYLQPFFSTNKAVALRSFTEAVNDEKSNFHRHAEDYTLFHLGRWEEAEGEIQIAEIKTSLGLASEFITQDQ